MSTTAQLLQTAIALGSPGGAVDLAAYPNLRTLLYAGGLLADLVDVQVSNDDTEWTDLVTLGSTGSRQRCAFPDAPFRYIRSNGAAALTGALSIGATLDNGASGTAAAVGSLNLAVAGGPGAAFNLAAGAGSVFPRKKVFLISGGVASDVIILEFSADGVHWAQPATSQPSGKPPGLEGGDTSFVIDIDAQYVRANQLVGVAGAAVLTVRAAEKTLTGSFSDVTGLQLPSPAAFVVQAFSQLPTGNATQYLSSVANVIVGSTPSLAPATQDGQLVTYVNEGPHNIVLQDNGTLVGNELLLGAAQRILNPHGQLTVRWNATTGLWEEQSFEPGNLAPVQLGEQVNFAAPYVEDVVAQNVTAAGNTLNLAPTLAVSLPGGSISLTSNPSITKPVEPEGASIDGVEMDVLNVDAANTLTINRGNHVLLGAAARAIGPGGHLRVKYSVAEGAWVEQQFVAAAS